jgi:hypothetical protein
LGFLPKPFTASQFTRRNLVCHFPAIALGRLIAIFHREPRNFPPGFVYTPIPESRGPRRVRVPAFGESFDRLP